MNDRGSTTVGSTHVGSIMIPASVVTRDDLTLVKKALYGKIYSFTFHSDLGHCNATNAYLSRQIGVKPDTVSKYIGELEEAGLVEREITRNESGEVTYRVLKATDPGTSESGPPSPMAVGDPSPMRIKRDVGCSYGGVGSSLRDSPDEAGQGDRDSDDDSESTASPSSFDAAEWVHGVQAGDRQLSEGVYPLLWRGEEVPDSSPREWSFQAEMGTLSRLRREYGASDHEVALFMVGLDRMREAGDLSGIDPGEGLTTGYAAASEAWEAEVLWHSALRRGQRWWREVAPTDDAVLEAVAGGADA